MEEPDKWCIKVTSENKEAIEKWRTIKILLGCKGYCVNKNSFDDPSIGYWYPDKPSGYTEISFEEFKVYTNKPLKQAVHCTTQKEWDFVTEKLGYKWSISPGVDNSWNKYGNKTFINLSETHFNSIDNKNYNYQILSFQEWCNLSGYKMEKEVKFEVGKWYSFNWDWCSSNSTIIAKIKEINEDSFSISWRSYLWKENDYSISDRYNFRDVSNIKELSIDEVQKYLPDNHPNKIKSNQEFKVGDYVVLQYSSAKEIGYDTSNNNTRLKVGHIDKIANFRDGQTWSENSKIRWVGLESEPHNGVIEILLRHATQEEINNYLISIGQIPAEKYLFKKLEEDALTWEIKTEGIRWTEPVSMTNENWKSKMILSINDEELPMVNIIKTNTVKQLLNNE